MTELTTEIVQMIFDKGYETGLDASEEYMQGMHDTLTEHFKIVPKSFDEDEKILAKAPEGETLSAMATMVCDALPDLDLMPRKCFADTTKAPPTAFKYMPSNVGTFWIHSNSNVVGVKGEQFYFTFSRNNLNFTSGRYDKISEAYNAANDKYREIVRSLFEEFDRAGV